MSTRPDVPPQAWLLVIATASAVAWLQLTGLPSPARMWAAVLLVPLPALMIAEGRKLSEIGTLPRAQAYVSTIISLWILAAATLAVAWASGYERALLGLKPLDAQSTALIAVVLTIAGIAILFAFHRAGVREPAIMRELLPASRGDRVLFPGGSITAGWCEDIVFRGFLIHAIVAATSSVPAALILSSGAFGVAHAYQQPAGALRAGLLGLILAVPFVLTGSIIPSIVAHLAIDMLSGLWLAKYLLR